MKKHRIVPLLVAALLTLMVAMPAQAAEQVNKKYETNDTLIGIGSVSKMFVTTAVMQLVEQGKVDIDAPVTDYLPEFSMADSRYKDITVRMLMNHIFRSIRFRCSCWISIWVSVLGLSCVSRYVRNLICPFCL